MIPVLVSLWLAGCSGAGQTTDPIEIMRRVGCNQDRALRARLGFVYDQKLFLQMRRANGRPARREKRDYTVTPTLRGTTKTLTHFEGAYWTRGRMVSYDKPGYEYKSIDIDGSLIDSMANGLTADQDSRDGIGSGLFPLRTREQQGCLFKMLGREDYRGRPAYRIGFEPPRNSPEDSGGDGACGAWKGEALIDATSYQPISIETKLAWKIPGMVKVLLGTNIEGLGFSVSYARFADGVWFPVSYGAEFHVRAVFFYERNLSISLENTNFRQAKTETSIQYQGAAAAPESDRPSCNTTKR
jgi:hypothetical protein